MSLNNLLSEIEPYKEKIPQFILKLYHILEKKQHSEYLTWFNEEEILIKNPKKFQEKVLPHYFRHKHLASFIRQLNMYKFSKVPKIQKEKNHMYFKNEFFKRGNIENLCKLKRNVKKKNVTEQTISPGRQEEFDNSDNISINEKLIENDQNLKKLEQYKSYVKESALKIKEIAGKYSLNPIFENDLKSIMSICDDLMLGKKEDIVRSFGFSSSIQSYENMTLLNISQKVIPKIEGEFIFPSQCSLSHFNSFQNN